MLLLMGGSLVWFSGSCSAWKTYSVDVLFGSVGTDFFLDSDC